MAFTLLDRVMRVYTHAFWSNLTATMAETIASACLRSFEHCFLTALGPYQPYFICKTEQTPSEIDIGQILDCKMKESMQKRFTIIFDCVIL